MLESHCSARGRINLHLAGVQKVDVFGDRHGGLHLAGQGAPESKKI